MVVAAVIGLVLFPFAIADVFSSGRGVEALDNLTSGFAGYGARLLAFARILAELIARILLHKPPIGCIINISVSCFLRDKIAESAALQRIVRLPSETV